MPMTPRYIILVGGHRGRLSQTSEKTIRLARGDLSSSSSPQIPLDSFLLSSPIPPRLHFLFPQQCYRTGMIWHPNFVCISLYLTPTEAIVSDVPLKKEEPHPSRSPLCLVDMKNEARAIHEYVTRLPATTCERSNPKLNTHAETKPGQHSVSRVVHASHTASLYPGAATCLMWPRVHEK